MSARSDWHPAASLFGWRFHGLSFGGQAAFRQRGICYANCRRTLPPTNAAPAQPGKR